MFEYFFNTEDDDSVIFQKLLLLKAKTSNIPEINAYTPVTS